MKNLKNNLIDAVAFICLIPVLICLLPIFVALGIVKVVELALDRLLGSE